MNVSTKQWLLDMLDLKALDTKDAFENSYVRFEAHGVITFQNRMATIADARRLVEQCPDEPEDKR